MTETSSSLEMPAKQWTTIFGKIISKKHNYFGLFVLMIHTKQKYVEKASVAFSIYSDIHELSFDEGWYSFEQRIEDLKYGGNYAATISMDLQNALQFEAKRPEFVSDLLDLIDKNKIDLLQKELNDFFKKSIVDNYVTTDLATAFLNDEELESGRIRKEIAAEQPEENHKDDIKFIAAKLVLAPVGGKLVTELRKGDKILVTIPPSGTRENYYLDLWQLRKPEGGIKSIPAAVSEIKEQGKGIQLYVHIKDEIYSQILEEEKVLVKLYLPEKEESKNVKNEKVLQKEKKEKKPKGEKSGSLGLITLLGAAVLIGLSIAYFYIAQ